MPQIKPSQWTSSTPESTTILVNTGGQQSMNDFGHHTPRKSHSIKSPDDNEIIHELRVGEQYQGQWADGGTTERCELGMNARPPVPGNTFVVSFKYKIDDTGDISSPWVVTGQLHSAKNVSPPVEIKYNGNNRMALSANHGSSTNPIWRTAWIDTADVTRDHWYDMRLEWIPGTSGLLILWRDGVRVCDYRGPVGYTDQTQTYWKQGVYRGRPSRGETLRVHYKDLKIEQGLQLPLPPPSTGTTPPVIPPVEGDKIVHVTIESPVGVKVEVEINQDQ